MSRHYLDHASTTTLRPEAREAVLRWLGATGTDPGRMHAEALAARVAVEEAREQVAGLLGARSREVVFTSGATEAIATACLGVAGRGRGQVVPAIEHSAVRESAAKAGPVTAIGVDRVGRIDAEMLIEAIGPDTALVHVQWGNHEVGTVQPVAEVVAACRERGVLVHVDAAQAAGRTAIDFGALGADLLSVSAHKLGGPPGIGALLVRRGLRISPLLLGGDQERARRAGMENVPAIAGFGAAAANLTEPGRLETEATEQRRLTDRVLAIVDALDGVVVYGDVDDGRLPHLVCLGITGIEPQAVLLGLDRAGIAAHSGSACSTESLEPSPVLEAMGVDAHRSLRISVGWDSADADIDALLGALPDVISGLPRTTFDAVTIYLVRHAQAGNRHEWNGDDEHRPLSPKGLRQARMLAEQYGDRPITRVLSSTYIRCRQTVEPIAELRGVPVEPSDAMTEGASTRTAVELVRSLAGTEAMLCSHGDVIPEVISVLAADGVAVNGRRSAAKGGTFVIEAKHGKLVSATYAPPP